MSEMYVVWLGALALVLVSLGFLLPSLLQDSTAPVHTGDNTLRALYQQQLQDLAREHRAGTLNAAELAQAEEELLRRLLADLDQRIQLKSWQQKTWLPRLSGLVLAVALPLVSFALYIQVGDPQAAARLAMADDMNHGAGNVQVESMVQGLANRLQQDPGNLPGWVMLARSYETMERYPEAVSAYQQAIAVAKQQDFAVEDQARLWADLADAIGSEQGGKLGGAAGDAIRQALKLQPQQAKALALAGSAALQQDNYPEARKNWQILLGLLEPGSDMALKVQDDLLNLEVLLNNQSIESK